MPGILVMGQFEPFGWGIAAAALCVSMAAYYIAVEWRKVREAQIEADLKRDLVQKGLAAEDIERVLKASAPSRD